VDGEMLPLNPTFIDPLGAELVVLVGRFDKLGKAVGGLLSSATSTLCSSKELGISDR
jgi:hypothetical protein